MLFSDPGVQGRSPWSREQMKESPIFLKSYETLVWLFEHTAKFPRNQRVARGLAGEPQR
jgi:hypothetical protein